MTDLDTDNFISAYARHSKALAQANERNKAVVFDALAAAGITTVSVTFDGEGDSGQIENISAFANDQPAELPSAPITMLEASWNTDTLTPCDFTLHEAIERLSYDYLEQEHGGWENNEGAFGEFVFSVTTRSIELEFNGRCIEVDTSTHTF